MSKGENMENNEERKKIFELFFDEEAKNFKTLDTGIGEEDFRETDIVETVNGNKYVMKICSNSFTFPEKIEMWQRTIEEYRKLGYYCPRIINARNGGFPTVEYKGHRCNVYAEEFSVYKAIEDRMESDSKMAAKYEDYEKAIWTMTAKVAAKQFDYTDYPSGYCLFDIFDENDECDEVMENALEWKRYADTLPEKFRVQTDRIWKLWNDNRKALEKVYHELPTSVFQADLNATNLLIDDDYNFVGIYDFNLAGKDVFLNYLMRENFDEFEEEIELIFRALDIAKEFYTFSENEKKYALMIYRCLKPLWFIKIETLKSLKDNEEEIKKYLDKTEHYLTCDIDFRSHMEA